MSDLILGRFVRLACPWCSADTYAVPGVDAMACATHGRAWFGAPEPQRPVPGADNWRRLGQTGAACYRHEPRSVTGLEDVVRAVPPFVVVPRRRVEPVDGAPSSVALLARREDGQAWYWAALWREGADTRPAARRDADVEEGAKSRAREVVPPLDRWALEETIVVVWRRDGDRGFRLWRRRGRSGWTVRCTWRRRGGVLAVARGTG